MKYIQYTIVEGTTITAQELEAPERDGSLVEVDLAESSGRSAQYARDIRGTAHALWAGTVDIGQAFDIMYDTVRIGLTRAWHEGAMDCGIQASELTPEEITQLTQVIASEQSRVFPFLEWAKERDKASGGKRGVVTARANMWGLRYDDVATRARLLACADQKLEWVQGPTSDQCPTCSRMNGKVKRASQWERNGVHPRAPYNPTIQCHGWRCLCELVPTDKPLSRGPLPRWP